MKTLFWIGAVLALLFGLLQTLGVTGVGRAGAFAGTAPAPIPHDAVRLRIIANSNSPYDQNLKRAIRDRVIALIGARVDAVRTPSQAAATIADEVPRVEAVVESMLKAYKAPYSARTTFGPAPFPTKVYGNRVYPAGTYMALRVTLGKGTGANWWCVLFPPLCFVALTDGDAVAATKAFPDYKPLAVTYVAGPGGKGKIPVYLRLAALDYGEEWWKEFSAQLAGLWRMMSTIL